jgi:hypothetical protein
MSQAEPSKEHNQLSQDGKQPPGNYAVQAEPSKKQNQPSPEVMEAYQKSVREREKVYKRLADA